MDLTPAIGPTDPTNNTSYSGMDNCGMGDSNMSNPKELLDFAEMLAKHLRPKAA